MHLESLHQLDDWTCGLVWSRRWTSSSHIGSLSSKSTISFPAQQTSPEAWLCPKRLSPKHIRKSCSKAPEEGRCWWHHHQVLRVITEAITAGISLRRQLKQRGGLFLLSRPERSRSRGASGSSLEVAAEGLPERTIVGPDVDLMSEPAIRWLYWKGLCTGKTGWESHWVGLQLTTILIVD